MFTTMITSFGFFSCDDDSALLIRLLYVMMWMWLMIWNY